MKRISPHNKSKTTRDLLSMIQINQTPTVFTDVTTPSQNNLTSGVPVQSLKILADFNLQIKKGQNAQSEMTQLIKKQKHQSLPSEISTNSSEKKSKLASQLQSKSFQSKESSIFSMKDVKSTNKFYFGSQSSDSVQFQKIFPPKRQLLMPNTTNQQVKKFPNVFGQDVLKQATDILQGKDPFFNYNNQDQFNFINLRTLDKSKPASEKTKELQKSEQMSITKISQRTNILTSQSRHQRRVQSQNNLEISTRGVQENDKYTVEILNN